MGVDLNISNPLCNVDLWLVYMTTNSKIYQCVDNVLNTHEIQQKKTPCELHVAAGGGGHDNTHLTVTSKPGIDVEQFIAAT